MKNLEDLEKKINSELTTKIKETFIKHDQLYIKINAEDLGSKTYHVVVSPDLGNWQSPDPNFVENVKKQIDKDIPILISCAAGGRSLIAANLLEQEGYTAMNLSDGFSGNGEDPGWKNAGLPSIIDN